MTSFLASIDNQKFLGRSGSCKYNFLLFDPFLQILTFLWIIIIHILFFDMMFSKQITVNNNTCAFFKSFIMIHMKFVYHIVEFFLWMLNNVYLISNSSSSWWLITSNHNNFNTSRSALVYRQIYSWSWWIIQ